MPLKIRHNPLNAVLFIAAGGERPPNDRIRDGILLTFQPELLRPFRFFRFRLHDTLYLFLRLGKQDERRQNGGLFARRLNRFLIGSLRYRYTISARTISSAWAM